MAKQILIITGDGGESYETWFAVHRFQEAGYETRVAAPSKRRLNLVMHDFEPGWDTYKEGPGYVMESDLTFDDVTVGDYEAVLCIGGRAPEYLRNDPRVLAILREFDEQEKWLFAICHGVQLVAAAGLPGVGGPPDSVLYSPGVPVRFGPPLRSSARTDRAPAS